MAIKVVQNVQKITASPGVAGTSSPISLKSGYLRISIASSGVGCYVAIGTDPVATSNDFHIGTYTAEVLKERIARQQIVGIITGSTTKLVFESNAGNPFLTTDYVSIEGAPTVGINTTHNPVISRDETSITINYNSSSIVNPNITGSTVSRSVKVSAYTTDTNNGVSVTEVVSLVSE